MNCQVCGMDVEPLEKHTIQDCKDYLYKQVKGNDKEVQ